MIDFQEKNTDNNSQSNLKTDGENLENDRPNSIKISRDDLNFIAKYQLENNLDSETEALSKLLKLAQIQLENLNSKDDFSGKNWQEKQKIKSDDRVLKAIKSIMEYNDYTASENKFRFKITLRLLMDITKARHSIIKRVMDEHKLMIDDHNNKYDFPFMQNRDNPDNPTDIFKL